MKKILDEVENYYSHKIREHGTTAKGVDWNSQESQNLRFEVLLRLIAEKSNFSIMDYGCGYGALIDEIKSRYSNVRYIGFDISKEMLAQAKSRNGESETIKWISEKSNERYDFIVSSGVFNVRLNQDHDVWREYVLTTLIEMNEKSIKGFSFNMLTKYSDAEYMKNYLYYADPCYYFDYCKNNFSRYVNVFHDYPLYEFTITVLRK